MKIEKLFFKFFEQFTALSGRSSRAEFWGFFFFIFGIVFAVAYLSAMFNTDSFMKGTVLVGSILITLAAIRRLHDVGRSGRWIFIMIFPPAALVLFYWLISPGVQFKQPKFEFNPYSLIYDPQNPNQRRSGKLRTIDIDSILHPVFMLNIAKYFLVVVCGAVGIIYLMAFFGLHSVQTYLTVWQVKAEFFLGLILLSFAYLGWKNIGNLGFSGSKSAWIVFFILACIATLFLAAAPKIPVEAYIFIGLSCVGLIGLVWMETSCS